MVKVLHLKCISGVLPNQPPEGYVKIDPDWESPFGRLVNKSACRKKLIHGESAAF
jgi:hypothetical protein